MSRCGLCNRPLPDAGSIELGFDPGCWGQLSATERASVIAAQGIATATGPGGAPPGSEAAPPSGVEARTTAVGVDAPTQLPVVPGPAASTFLASTSSVPRRSGSPLAVVASWTVVLLAVFVLLEYWRWVLMGVAFVGTVAAIGLLVERYQHGRAGHGGPGDP